MPKLMNDSMEKIVATGAGGYHFSGVRPADLGGAGEYTLVTIVVDITGSVIYFADDLLNCTKQIIQGCRKSARPENLLIRFVTFNYYNNIQEVHGFKLLSMIDENDYKPFVCGGMTALHDAAYSSITPTLTYAKSLFDHDFINCNGAIYIITDGVDNNSRVSSPNMIKEELTKIVNSETIESLITILIGVNTKDCKDELEKFKNEAGLTEFVDTGDATPQKLAKVAAFVSKSVSSTSQALGTGAASQPLNF